MFIEFIGWVATLSSQVMNLSALPSNMEIIKSRDTLAYSAEPYISSLSAAVVNVLYAVLAGRWIVIVSSCFSSSINGTFFFIHWRYSKTPDILIRSLLLRVIFVSVLSLSVPAVVSIFASSEMFWKVTVWWFGFVLTVVYCIVYFSQLSKFKEIIKTQNSASISPQLTAGTAFSLICWTMYSFLVWDVFYLMSNAAGFISISFQVYFLIKYPRIQPSNLINSQNSVELPPVVGNDTTVSV